jgi:16S rRNA C967 or C1407 C5-methylase (RsmB/RsmF family)
MAAEPREAGDAPGRIPAEAVVETRRRPAPRAGAGGAGDLAVATSHPAWLVARWIERFGPARARAILEADNLRPGVHLRPHAARVSARRLARLLENARRQSLPLLPVVADARDLALRRPADFVLADVPCLGTGTLRRRVDARWRKTPASLPELTALQRGILSHAADLLAPGGRLLYATCSLEREENEDAAAWILAARGDLRLVDLAPHVEPAFRLRAGEASPAMLFLTPELGDCDGAFAALLEKVA